MLYNAFPSPPPSLSHTISHCPVTRGPFLLSYLPSALTCPPAPLFTLDSPHFSIGVICLALPLAFSLPLSYLSLSFCCCFCCCLVLASFYFFLTINLFHFRPSVYVYIFFNPFFVFLYFLIISPFLIFFYLILS